MVLLGQKWKGTGGPAGVAEGAGIEVAVEAARKHLHACWTDCDVAPRMGDRLVHCEGSKVEQKYWTFFSPLRILASWTFLQIEAAAAPAMAPGPRGVVARTRAEAVS